MKKSEREIVRAVADGGLLFHPRDRGSAPTGATLTNSKRTKLVPFETIDALVECGAIEESPTSTFSVVTYCAPNARPLSTFERAEKTPRGSLGKCVSCRREFYAAAVSDARCCRECAGEVAPRSGGGSDAFEPTGLRGFARRRGRTPREE